MVGSRPSLSCDHRIKEQFSPGVWLAWSFFFFNAYIHTRTQTLMEFPTHSYTHITKQRSTSAYMCTWTQQCIHRNKRIHTLKGIHIYPDICACTRTHTDMCIYFHESWLLPCFILNIILWLDSNRHSVLYIKAFWEEKGIQVKESQGLFPSCRSRFNWKFHDGWTT